MTDACPDPEVCSRGCMYARCHAANDGDCYWTDCPQKIKQQSHCPLDLCPFDERDRARKLDDQCRRATAASMGQIFPGATRCGTLALWIQMQYDADLADWESRAKAALTIAGFAEMLAAQRDASGGCVCEGRFAKARFVMRRPADRCG